MAKRNYLKIEYTLTVLIIIAMVLIIVPFDFENSLQADFISKWKDKYSRLEYMFNVINAHEKDEILKSLKRAKNPEEREHILINLVQPYFRLHKEKKSRYYVVKFLDNTRVSKACKFYFDDIYKDENGMIVGIKDLETKTSKDPMFMMMFDVNGTLRPNKWGKDIYGVNIYEDGIKPFGYDLTTKELEKDCSISGTGLGCSYYYKIGGGFND